MKQLKRFMKNESGASALIETAIFLPVAIMVVFFLLYLGLFILQHATVSSYAQKIAYLAAREVAAPGYSTLLAEQRYQTGAIEADFRLDDSEDGKYNDKVTIDNRAEKANIRAYRYWSPNPLGSENEYYERILTNLVKDNSILAGGPGNSVTATITCKNHILSQDIHVEVEQVLVRFAVLDYFHIKNPTVKAEAVASVNDVDELVRNTDFAVDSIEALAKRFNIDIPEMKGKLEDCLKRLGIVY